MGDHPWAVSTANFAELCYRLASAITAAGTVPLDANSASFFSQTGIDAQTTPTAAAAALQSAGDQMLQAIIFHSDHLELSEQFDASTGYEKSVSNLSWSYAPFLSAVRARYPRTTAGRRASLSNAACDRSAACAGIAGTRQRRIFMQRDAPITVPISRCEASSRTRA